MTTTTPVSATREVTELYKDMRHQADVFFLQRTDAPFNPETAIASYVVRDAGVKFAPAGDFLLMRATVVSDSLNVFAEGEELEDLTVLPIGETGPFYYDFELDDLIEVRFAEVVERA